ncbi:bestrophin-like domain [Microvirga sp. 2TAF3]|uniref:bestrophin-like domain n=1 Tax=Microvirga sp. 2TAF3 TaxID=3233014 RepID=UPI003F950DD7
MIDWLHRLPVALGATVVCAVFLIPTLLGSVFLQPFVGRFLQGEKNQNALVGLLLNSFTLYYGVLLALLSIAVFNNYVAARDSIGREAATIRALYRDVGGYPEPARTVMRDLLRQYVEDQIGPGWREQRREGISPRSALLVDQLSNFLLSFRPNRQNEEDLHRETLRTFDEFIERRRIRVLAAGTTIPPVIWYVVLTGAVLNVFVLWLFNLKRTTHFILGGILTIFIALVIYMVAVLDRPFRGAHGLQPDDLIELRQQMGPQM